MRDSERCTAENKNQLIIYFEFEHIRHFISTLQNVNSACLMTTLADFFFICSLHTPHLLKNTIFTQLTTDSNNKNFWYWCWCNRNESESKFNADNKNCSSESNNQLWSQQLMPSLNRQHMHKKPTTDLWLAFELQI